MYVYEYYYVDEYKGLLDPIGVIIKSCGLAKIV